jgi:hypothetical protein
MPALGGRLCSKKSKMSQMFTVKIKFKTLALTLRLQVGRSGYLEAFHVQVETTANA